MPPFLYRLTWVSNNFLYLPSLLIKSLWTTCSITTPLSKTIIWSDEPIFDNLCVTNIHNWFFSIYQMFEIFLILLKHHWCSRFKIQNERHNWYIWKLNNAIQTGEYKTIYFGEFYVDIMMPILVFISNRYFTKFWKTALTYFLISSKDPFFNYFY